MTAPEYSILITSYRSLRFLEECLGSVLRSTGPEFELLFLENGSPEPEAEWIAKHLPDPRLRVFQVSETRYFAGGINYLAERARGRWLVLLNADARVEPDWLEHIDAVIRATGFEAVTADVREASHPDVPGNQQFTIDAFGLMRFSLPDPKGPVPDAMIGGCGFAVRRDVYAELGGFDGDYRMYFEDVDLCWRMLMRGYRIGYAPAARVYHVGQGSTKSGGFLWNRFRGRRNRIWTFLKDAGWPLLAVFLPAHLLLGLAETAFDLLRGRVRAAVAGAAALAAGYLGAPVALAKRGAIQRTRVLGDGALIRRGFLSARPVFWPRPGGTQKPGASENSGGSGS